MTPTHRDGRCRISSAVPAPRSDTRMNEDVALRRPSRGGRCGTQGRARMRMILLPALALGAMSAAAAAEPTRLTDAQLDAVAAGQLDVLVGDVRSVVEGLLTNPDFQGGLTVSDPNDLAFPVIGVLIDVLKVIPTHALAAVKGGDAGSDGAVVVARPEIVSKRTRVVGDSVFSRFPELAGSSLGALPTVATGSGGP